MSSSQMTLMDNRLSILLAIGYSSINVATTKHTEALLILSFPEIIIFQEILTTGPRTIDSGPFETIGNQQIKEKLSNITNNIDINTYQNYKKC